MQLQSAVNATVFDW